MARELHAAMAEVGAAAYEEALIDLLLEDLESNGEGRQQPTVAS